MDKARLWQYAQLVRLHKPIGISLLLWPVLWALWIAGKGHPDTLVLLVFVVGVVLMRSAGCAVNDLADRGFDGHVERTRHRPLASGAVSPKEAAWVFVILSLMAFALVLLMNPQTIMMSFVAVLLAVVYPFVKRVSHLPQVVLGAAFAWGVPMAFMAQAERVTLEAGLLFLSTLLWTVAYDTQYAMVDREDDLKIGVKSTAIFFGRADRVMIALLQTLMMVSLLLVGVYSQLSLGYYLGLFAASLLLLHQQRLIRNREAKNCFKAFQNNHWVGLLVFLGLVLHYNV